MGPLLACVFAALGSGVLPPVGRYVYVEDASRWVSVIRGPWRVVGHLDAAGKLTETHRFRWEGPVFGGVISGELLNGSPLRGKPLYELRAGLLVPGTLDDEGTFAPDGGQAIRFAEYKYTPTAPRIWNLPGHFLTEPGAKRFRESYAERARQNADPRRSGTPGFNFSRSPPQNREWQ
jgi:hypothetical protein